LLSHRHSTVESTRRKLRWRSPPRTFATGCYRRFASRFGPLCVFSPRNYGGESAPGRLVATPAAAFAFLVQSASRRRPHQPRKNPHMMTRRSSLAACAMTLTLGVLAGCKESKPQNSELTPTAAAPATAATTGTTADDSASVSDD